MPYGGAEKPGFRSDYPGTKNTKGDATGRSSGQDGGQKASGYPHEADGNRPERGGAVVEGQNLRGYVHEESAKRPSVREAKNGVNKNLRRHSQPSPPSP